MAFIKYSDLRKILEEEMRTGDALLWDGAGFVQDTIGWITGKDKTAPSHASMIINIGRRIGVVEANYTDRQLVIRSLSAKLFAKHGKASWLPTTLTTDQRVQIYDSAIDRVMSGIEYDTWGCIECIPHAFFPHWFKGPKLKQFSIFCSGELALEWMQVGYIPKSEYAPFPSELPALIGQEPITIEMDVTNAKRR